jgi:hypothetical protein
MHYVTHKTTTPYAETGVVPWRASLEEANQGHAPTRHSNQPVSGQSAGAVFQHLVPVLGEGGERSEPEPERIVLTENRRYEQWPDTVSARHHF